MNSVWANPNNLKNQLHGANSDISWKAGKKWKIRNVKMFVNLFDLNFVQVIWESINSSSNAFLKFEKKQQKK